MTVSPDKLPQVTVIMPVRDGERWLRQAIDSVLAQTLSNFELIVIDDGSVDTTATILDEVRRRDPRLIVLSQQRQGLVAALNYGLERSRAPLIARLDADDIALPDRLSRQCDVMRSQPNVVLLGGWAQTIGEDDNPSGKPRRPEHRRLRETLIEKNPFIHSTVMVRTEVARAVGGYRAAFEAAEDYDLWLRLSEIGEVAILPEDLILYRVHGGSVTQTRALRQMYSSRLAKLAAIERRSGRDDPAANLSAPPDWHASHAGDFERDSSRLFRFLDLASDATKSKEPDLAAVTSQLATLSSSEHKLARAAVRDLMRNPPTLSGPSRASLILLLARLGAANAKRTVAKGFASRRMSIL